MSDELPKTGTPIDQVKHVIVINSEHRRSGCEYCDYNELYGESGLINHYLQVHECELLHVGQITGICDDGLYHCLLAVIGSKDVPTEKPMGNLEKFLSD